HEEYDHTGLIQAQEEFLTLRHSKNPFRNGKAEPGEASLSYQTERRSSIAHRSHHTPCDEPAQTTPRSTQRSLTRSVRTTKSTPPPASCSHSPPGRKPPSWPRRLSSSRRGRASDSRAGRTSPAFRPAPCESPR